MGSRGGATRLRTKAVWLAAWREFFELVAEPLGQVVKAQRCRESWLQGEAYRFFRFQKSEAFYVDTNTVVFADRKKRRVDFAAFDSDDTNAATRFVAELKLLGEGKFQQKVVTGGKLSALGELRTITPAHASLVGGPWGLIPDYVRLLQAESPLRMLLLVTQREEVPDDLGEVLRDIEFERRGTVLFENEAIRAKSWWIEGTMGG